jgi:hypothetical protein
MINSLKNLLQDEGGAITADWVLITAAVVGLGWLMYFYLHDPIEQLDGKSGTAIASVTVAPIVFPD